MRSVKEHLETSKSLLLHLQDPEVICMKLGNNIPNPAIIISETIDKSPTATIP